MYRRINVTCPDGHACTADVRGLEASVPGLRLTGRALVRIRRHQRDNTVCRTTGRRIYVVDPNSEECLWP